MTKIKDSDNAFNKMPYPSTGIRQLVSPDRTRQIGDEPWLATSGVSDASASVV